MEQTFLTSFLQLIKRNINMSYSKAVEKHNREKKKNVNWNKNAMDYETTDELLYKDIRKKNNNDMVNKPPHYNKSRLECIHAIEAATGEGYKHYLQGNIIKYIWRYPYKNGVEDLKKAQWYLKDLIRVCSTK